MPTSTPDFLQYCRDAHAGGLVILQHGSLNDLRSFTLRILEHQLSEDWQAEAVECYERAQRDFAALVEALTISRDFLTEEGYETNSLNELLARLSEPPGVEVGE